MFKNRPGVDQLDIPTVPTVGELIVLEDVGGSPGMPSIDGSNLTGVPTLYTAAVDPTVDDDADEGYKVGDRWVNTTTDLSFTCLDATIGAAVWLNLPYGPATGDLADSYPAPSVAKASKSFALAGVLSPASFSTTQDDYNPTNLATASMLRITTSADATITGLAGGADGRLLTVYNVGAYKLSLTKQSTSSLAANRFAMDNDALIKPDTAVVLQYDGTSSRWRVAGAGSSVPTLLPAPKFFEVETDISTTSPAYVTMYSGTFSLASSETNLIVLFVANVTSSNANRRIEMRILINGTSVGGCSGVVGAANIPFSASFLGQEMGVTGSNTYEVQWKINGNTARCRPVTYPDDENAALAIWSSAAP